MNYMVIKPTGILFQWMNTNPDLGLFTRFALNEMKTMEGAMKGLGFLQLSLYLLWHSQWPAARHGK